MEIIAVLVTRCGCSREIVIQTLIDPILVPLTRKLGEGYINSPEPKYLPFETRTFRFQSRVGRKAWYVEVE